MAPPNTPATLTIKVSLPSLAKLIDHSLLHPTLTDADIQAGLRLARRYGVAAACVKPYAVPLAAQELRGSGVRVCAVVGFPHGSSAASIKIAEAAEALAAGAHEVDMVINIGKALSGEWHYVEHEIDAINRLVTASNTSSILASSQHSLNPAGDGKEKGGEGERLLKVIFETAYLEDSHIIRLCQICTRLNVRFVKTCTGYAFTKLPSSKDAEAKDTYTYQGATPANLRLMRRHAGGDVEIKAAGGVRTLDDLFRALSLGATRIGATATQGILREAEERGIGEREVEVEVKALAPL